MKNLLIYISLLLLVGGLASCDVSVSRDSSDGSYYDNSIGGSLASFAIADSSNSLFTIVDGKLRTYDIATPADTIRIHDMALNNKYGSAITNVETIFPYGKHLYLGASDGMHIVDISTPSSPVYVSNYEHVTSCDPVVVQDTLAYVTLREGSGCGSWINELHVINVKNPENPQLVKEKEMLRPYGLGVDGDLLFVCDNGNLVVMNSDPTNLSEIKTFSNISATDVIPYNDVLIVLGDGELRQYSYKNDELTLLSTITNK